MQDMSGRWWDCFFWDKKFPGETVDTGLGGLRHCLKVTRAPKSLTVGAENCLGFGGGSLRLRVP